MFTIVDGVVAVILLGSAGMAFLRGFVHEVLAIAAWVGAGLVALYGFDHVHLWFRALVGVPWAGDAAAALSLFLLALLAFSLITKAVSNRVRKSALNSVDSSLGFVFGLLRGAVVVCLAYMMMAWMIAPDEPPAWLANAKTRPWLQRGAGALENLRPAGFGREEKKREERTATGDLEEDSRRGEEMANKAYRALAAPQPAAPPAATADEANKPQRQGYDKEQRHDMDRLFQTNR